MPARASDGTSLAKLVKMAIPICKQAQRQCPRTGPGRPPNFQDWKMAVLIMAGILERRKSAQYRLLHDQAWLYKKVAIRTCSNPAFDKTDLDRVVANGDGVRRRRWPKKTQ